MEKKLTRLANALGAANHGLTFGDNRLGAADRLSRLGFFGAYAGALVASRCTCWPARRSPRTMLPRRWLPALEPPGRRCD